MATGLGAIPVFLLGARAERLRPALWGMTAGVMAATSVLGLLVPAFDEGSVAAVLAGLVAGIAFLVVAEHVLDGRDDLHVGTLTGAGARRAALVFGVLFVHSLPEGFAIGSAWASDVEGLSLFIVLAIALQNVPEGTAAAIPLEQAGVGPWRQVAAAIATSLPQPLGAAIAFILVDLVNALLPASFGFAAGAMLALVVVELAPQAFTRTTWRGGAAGTAAGALVVIALAALLGTA